MEGKTEQASPVIRIGMTTQRTAAIAGILFSILLTTPMMLLRVSVGATSKETQVWPRPSAGAVVFALNLVPFAGIAFLWFIAVVRDRLGDYEDCFFATVLLGSSILSLCLFFAAAAVAGAIIIAFKAAPDRMGHPTHMYSGGLSLRTS